MSCMATPLCEVLSVLTCMHATCRRSYPVKSPVDLYTVHASKLWDRALYSCVLVLRSKFYCFRYSPTGLYPRQFCGERFYRQLRGKHVRESTERTTNLRRRLIAFLRRPGRPSPRHSTPKVRSISFLDTPPDQRTCNFKAQLDRSRNFISIALYESSFRNLQA